MNRKDKLWLGLILSLIGAFFTGIFLGCDIDIPWVILTLAVTIAGELLCISAAGDF